MDSDQKKRTIFIVQIACFAALIVLLIIIVGMHFSTAGYQKVNATITDIGVYTGKSVNNNSYSHFMTYSYTYKGKKYQATLKDYFLLGKQVGQTVTLYCDPANPEKVDNGSRFYAILLAFCIVLAFGVLLRVISRQSA